MQISEATVIACRAVSSNAITVASGFPSAKTFVTEINYDDYRDVAGIKMPFTWTVSQTYMQMTIKLTDLRPNAPVDATVFAKPASAGKR